MKCKTCDGTGCHPNPSPEVLDRALCTDSIPVPCPDCRGHGRIVDEDEGRSTGYGGGNIAEDGSENYCGGY